MTPTENLKMRSVLFASQTVNRKAADFRTHPLQMAIESFYTATGNNVRGHHRSSERNVLMKPEKQAIIIEHMV